VSRAELERVADQVLKELHHLGRIRGQSRESIPAHRSAALIDRSLEVPDGLLHDLHETPPA